MPLKRSALRSSKNSESGDAIEILNEIKREPYVDLTINNKLLQKNVTKAKNKRKSSSPAKIKTTELSSKKLSKSVTEVKTNKRTSKSRSPSRGRKASNDGVQRNAKKSSKKVYTKRELIHAKNKQEDTNIETIDNIDSSIIQTTNLRASNLETTPFNNAGHKYSLRQRDTQSQLRRMSPFNSIRFSSTPLKVPEQLTKKEVKPQEELTKKTESQMTGCLNCFGRNIVCIISIASVFIFTFYYLCCPSRASFNLDTYLECIRNIGKKFTSFVGKLTN